MSSRGAGSSCWLGWMLPWEGEWLRSWCLGRTTSPVVGGRRISDFLSSLFPSLYFFLLLFCLGEGSAPGGYLPPVFFSCFFFFLFLSFFVLFFLLLSVCLFVICLSVCMSLCPSVSLSIHLSICLSVCPSVCLPVCPSVCLFSISFRLSLFLFLPPIFSLARTFFPPPSSLGASSDLEVATKIARAMVTRFGMTDLVSALHSHMS